MKIIHGDCLEVLKTLPDNSVDSVVTDPPYGLSFMGKHWDYDVPSKEIWKEVIRVLKPGGYLLSFAGSRTYHRMAVNIEDAGFEIRDQIMWVYGSGFPKSRNIGLDVDKRNGVTKNRGKAFVVAGQSGQRDKDTGGDLVPGSNTMGAYVAQNEWSGWGTALKPAHEPIVVARKPVEGTIAENCLKWGVGGINIDACRVSTDEDQRRPSAGGENGLTGTSTFKIRERKVEEQIQHTGRFPANFIHDGSDEVVELFPNESQRFFYCAKASKSERNRGCEGLEEKSKPLMGEFKENPGRDTPKSSPTPRANHHPTVKPIALMEYLVKLVSREGATVLDPFAGSGTTGIACKKLGRDFIGIEREAEYVKIAEARINKTPDTLI